MRVGTLRCRSERPLNGLAYGIAAIHTFRHTHASRLVQNGMWVYEVKEILGHADIKTTLRYAHLEQRQVTSKARDVINRLNRNSDQLALVQKPT